MNSVSATEMAKLGKCEKMIKRSRVSKKINERAPGKPSNAFNGTSDTLRGEFAHFSYESATRRFMTDKQVKFRRMLQLCLSGALAMGLLSLAALYAG
ncbi:hypothetical protein [Vibrio vulnificus]|uniref:hypothetical protein n=1 Tax=Vibrio vulnificus TaxID=672 RepID=UPI003242FB29